MFQAQYVILCSCLSMCAICHLGNPTTVSVPCKERMIFFCCSTRGIHAGQSPSVGYQRNLLEIEDWLLLLKLKLLCLFMSKGWFHPVLDCFFPQWFWYQDAVGESAQTPTPDNSQQVSLPQHTCNCMIIQLIFISPNIPKKSRRK